MLNCHCLEGMKKKLTVYNRDVRTSKHRYCLLFGPDYGDLCQVGLILQDSLKPFVPFDSLQDIKNNGKMAALS